MPSRIRKFVEPTLGWLFVIVLLAVLAAVLYVATRPDMEFTRRVEAQQAAGPEA